MSESQGQVRLQGLTPLQLAELKGALGANAQNYLSEDAPSSLTGGRHGEPGLITVLIVLGPAVISAVSLWLAKQKRRRTEKFRWLKVGADGASESIELDLSSYAEGASSAGAIETMLKQVLK